MTDDCTKKCKLVDIEKGTCSCRVEHPLEKTDKLKEAIEELGYKAEETEKGEIVIKK